MLYWYKSTNTDAEGSHVGIARAASVLSRDVSASLGTQFRYSVYLLFWYKSTNTDDALSRDVSASLSLGIQFTCFPGTKVRILTHDVAASSEDSCVRMLTYADVCWRMLTYADVC